MIVTEIYNGQGFGNQLWCYVTARVIARDKGYAFGIMHPERFKGSDLMDVDFGENVEGGAGPEGGPPTMLPHGISSYYAERAIFHPLNGSDIRTYDAGLMSICDGTKIDGCMQDERYIAHRKEEIRDWLKIRPEADCTDFATDGVCIINFRGSGYAKDRDFFLPKRYWRDAMREMRKIDPRFRFVVVTEDAETARAFFPELEIHHWNLAKDYAVIHRARYIILSNSSFAWFPTWLNPDLKLAIAPKYWGRHNISDGYWSLGYNITSGWKYLDRNGRLSSYEECMAELGAYEADHPDVYANREPLGRDRGRRLRSEAQIFRTFARESSFMRAIGRMAVLYATPTLASIKKRLYRMI